MKIRTLIVDDEPLAREWVRNGLQDVADVEIVGECGDGFEAVKAIADQQPDLVLLDVQMPGLDGFGVLASLDVDAIPAVVFITAFDRYALKAFEAHAVDYLMKPFSSDRLHAAVERARAALGQSASRVTQTALAALLEEIRRERCLPEWLLIKKEDRACSCASPTSTGSVRPATTCALHLGRET